MGLAGRPAAPARARIERFRYGEIISTTITTADKFTQRGKPYLQMLLDFRNERNVLKARWWCSLILPETRRRRPLR